jgi:tetratricopeptide (TPR) repeat protein
MRLTSTTLPALLGAALLAGCAAGSGGMQVNPADIPALEAQAQERPTDAALMTRLGIAYYGQQNWARARDVLATAATLNPGNYRALVYLGLSYEELGALDSARTTYERARGATRGARQRGEIDDRLQLLTRKELAAAARRAIAQESTLAATPPEANTVAVFPFRYLGTNDTLRPLERGLAQLVVSDLGKVRSLKLLEREQVQALVDELRLASDGRVDPATGARGGRLLRAQNVVQGSLQEAGGNDVRLDANAVNSTTASVSGSGSASGPLDQLLDQEKTVVFQLLDRMGIQLTPAERTSLEERPTRDLQAFLLYSEGLAAEDRGDFGGAASLFGRAAARDPGFRDAGARAQASQSLSNAAAQSPTDLAGGDGGDEGGDQELRPLVDAINPSSGSLTDSRSDPFTSPPVFRPGLPESQGQDNVIPGTLLGTIIIIIPRP